MGYWNQGDELNNGKFLVEELLGSGGFGVTYKIRHTRTNKLYALKTLNELARSKPNFQQLQVKFINEAIALASCRHPHIVRVFPQGFQEGELWCMVMEYVEGEDLARYLERNGQFEESQAVEIITKVGKALSFVHEQDLLHRDIKPDNILLKSSDFSPVLIDFGLAREYTPGTIRSMTNSMTECYAPIEQYQARGNFGAWTDVYALAATLYVLVTKEVPFPARFRAHAQLPPPQQHNPQLSDRINEAILKGMAIEPGDRPQTVEEWLELLKPPSPKSLLSNAPLVKGGWGDLKVFEFDTVKVNDRGEIIKTEHHSARYFTEDLGNGINLEMIEIPGGTFSMGTEEQEIERLVKQYGTDRFKNESPQHQVTVPSLYMGKFQVTQVQWKRVAALPQVERELEAEPSYLKGNNLPVEQVSWLDAVEFCQRLSIATGKEYKLPSEAQWEYACRAGTKTAFHFEETITTDLANYSGNCIYANELKGKFRETTTPVGSFPPNASGLYDLHGNVWEWCEDNWHNNYNYQGVPRDGSAWLSGISFNKVIRGGSWNLNPLGCRSAIRGYGTRDVRFNYIGFRVVCVAPRTT
ncbi:MAG: hypothetical protein Tsb0014_45260 [Pleurocapsa sp.]